MLGKICVSRFIIVISTTEIM